MKVLQPDGYFTLGAFPVFVAKDRYCPDCGCCHDFEKCPHCGAWIEIQYGIGGLRKWCSKECGWGFIRYDSDMSADLTCKVGRACAAAPNPGAPRSPETTPGDPDPERKGGE